MRHHQLAALLIQVLATMGTFKIARTNTKIITKYFTRKKKIVVLDSFTVIFNTQRTTLKDNFNVNICLSGRAMSNSGGYGNGGYNNGNNSSYNNGGGYNTSSQNGGYNSGGYNSSGGYNNGASSDVGNAPGERPRGLQPTTNDKYKVSMGSSPMPKKNT